MFLSYDLADFEPLPETLLCTHSYHVHMRHSISQIIESEIKHRDGLTYVLDNKVCVCKQQVVSLAEGTQTKVHSNLR